MKPANRNRLTIFVACMTLSAAAPVRELAVGDPLPVLQGEYLTGTKAALPHDSSGRVALLALGFTYDSRFPVEAWGKRFRQDFGNQPRANFFEIPMIGGMARMGKWFIDSGMRRGTPKVDYGNVITVYGGSNVWKQKVGFKDPASAYLILIDGKGRVVWRFTGGFAEEPYAGLASNVSRLLRGD